MKKNYYTLLVLVTIHYAGIAQQPQLVKDLSHEAWLAANALYLTEVNGTVFFSQADDRYRRELWKSDGTATGTKIVKDINTTDPATFLGASLPNNLITVGNVLFFGATDLTVDNLGIETAVNNELWKSDGTSEGTVMVKDITNPGTTTFSQMTAVGISTLFFVTSGELWKSDGTSAGTVMVKDINTSGNSNPSGLKALGNVLYFTADNGSIGKELWMSDGTSAGTVLVKDINSGSASSSPSNLAVMNNTLYFSADNGTIAAGTGKELWKSDGTSAGTVLVKDIRSGGSSSSPAYLVAISTTLYFTADDGTNGMELWKSDGTTSGTVLVKDIYSGLNSSSIAGITVMGNACYFRADDGINGTEPWKSDGTSAGTLLIKDINSGINGSNPLNIVAAGNAVYFPANEPVHGTELWKSDGTSAGTLLVKDISYGIGSSITYLIAVGNNVYFCTDDGNHGKQLWKSDGTDAGTIMPKNSVNNTRGSEITEIVPAGNTLFFDARDFENFMFEGRELFKSDGTENGTSIVADINPGGFESLPHNITAVGNTVFFSADDGAGISLWKSDGINADPVKNINIDGTPSIGIGNTFYFSDGELWKSIGTSTLTALVKNINPSGNSNPSGFAAISNTLYFAADDGTNGIELWKSDGTSVGTTLVQNIRSGSSSSSPTNLTAVGSTLYFAADDGTNGIELWKSNGTGAALVKNIRSGSANSSPANLTAVGDTLYFTADDGTNGIELWKSDGTSAGTILVKNIKSGSASSSPANLTAAGNSLYFVADDGTNGIELWKSDGTSAGAVLVKNINTGTSSAPSNITAIGNTIYFTADDGTGIELWKSDGTFNGTSITNHPVSPNGKTSWVWAPSNLKTMNGVLYFIADDGYYGKELWKLIPCTALPVDLGNDTVICSGNVITLDAKNSGLGATYSWSNGATTQTIQVSAAGNYLVSITSNSACVSSDGIMLTINSLPLVNLGNDTAVCSGNTITLDAKNPGATYSWSNGATTKTITVSTTANYTVSVTDNNGCGNGTDAVSLTFNSLPSVDLGNDTAICSGNTVTLDAKNPGATYSWSNGATTKTITVSVAANYTVSVTNNGCVSAGAVSLTINSLPSVNLGNNITIMSGNSIVLDAGNPGASYLWSTGATTNTISVSSAANYFVNVTDNNGCKGADTIKITISTGIEDYVKNAVHIMAYPNPNKGEFMVELSSQNNTSIQNVTIGLFSYTGQLIYQEHIDIFNGTYQNKINLEDYSEGVYNLQVILNDKIINKKILYAY